MANGCGPHYIPRGWMVKIVPEDVLDFFESICTIHDIDYNTYQPKVVSDCKMMVLMWEATEKVKDHELRKRYQKWAKILYWSVRIPIISHISWYSKGK